MKIGLIADTHDNLPKIYKAVEIFNSEEVEVVLHCGDFISPFTARPFKGLKAHLIGVFGNNDGEKLGLLKAYKEIGEIYENFHTGVVGERKFFITHNEKIIDSISKSGDFDIIAYGHTHKLDVRKSKPLIINPGECCGWLTGRSTIVIVELDSLSSKIVEIHN